MQTNTLKLYSLEYGNAKTYLFAAFFVVGNVVLPQLCHVIPNGGITWLPIYFFTLIGAYKYGWRVGILTAIASPIVNSVLFGMPPTAVLPAILLKSILLAGFAGFTASRFKKASLRLIGSVVIFYQFFGTLGEWVMNGDLYSAMQDFRIGIPGMFLQLFGGWAIIHFLMRK
jgi:hypothetical protein